VRPESKPIEWAIESLDAPERLAGWEALQAKNYDLIIDSSGFDVAGCAAVIAEAFRRKFATGR